MNEKTGITIYNIDDQLTARKHETINGLQIKIAVEFVNYMNMKLKELRNLINDPAEEATIRIRHDSIRKDIYVSRNVYFEDVYVDEDIIKAKESLDKQIERIKKNYLRKIKKYEQALNTY